MARPKKPGVPSNVVAFPKSPPNGDAAVSPNVDRVLERILFGKPFKTLREANQFFEELRGELMGMFTSAGGDPESAQGLLARARVDPDEEHAAELLERVVDLARAELSDEYFASPCEDPDDLPETADAWLQAKVLLGERARLNDDPEEATRHFEDAYRYLPDQDIEWGLIGGYLATENIKAARPLIDGAADGVKKWFALSLCEYLANRRADATRALQRALQANRYLRDYLSGRRAPPREPNFDDKPGSRGEADECMFRLIPSWTAHPAALDWLTMQMLR